MPLYADEGGHLGPPPELLELARRRPSRPVPLAVCHAQEPQRLVAPGLELVPGEGRDVDEIEGPDLADLRVHQDTPPTAQDDDRVSVLVALQSRVASRPHLEVPELRGQALAVTEEKLSADVAERVSGFLVGLERNVLPPELFAAADGAAHSPAPTAARRGAGTGTAASWTRATNSRALSPSPWPAR